MPVLPDPPHTSALKKIAALWPPHYQGYTMWEIACRALGLPTRRKRKDDE